MPACLPADARATSITCKSPRKLQPTVFPHITTTNIPADTAPANMSSKVISVTSQQHFKTITSTSTYTIVDFYADWCGPCKVISPIFEQLAAAESKPGRITFCKVNVDNQRDVAGTYGISA